MRLSIEVDPEEQLPLKVWRFLVVRRDRVCQECGGTGNPKARWWALQAHHINEDGKDNRLANGRTLCSVCHAALHKSYLAASAAGLSPAALRKKSIARKRMWDDPERRAERLAQRANGKWPRPRKLSDEQVVEIRARRAQGEAAKALAEEFRVSPSLISKIACGRKRVRAGLDGPTRVIEVTPRRQPARAPEPAPPAPKREPREPARPRRREREKTPA